MKSVSKYKVDKILLLILIVFATISLLTIHSAQNILPSYMNYLTIKNMITKEEFKSKLTVLTEPMEENIKENKDFFNELYKKHGIDYKI